ncbi:MAG: transglutaminase-like cysteine peptidase [Microcystis sp. M035S1]|nr:transglutaminase-like cysteine peptidase [Microcystis sp. M035S1]
MLALNRQKREKHHVQGVWVRFFCISIFIFLTFQGFAQDRRSAKIDFPPNLVVGRDSVQLLADWKKMLLQSQTKSELEKIAAVNDFFNRRLAFEEDTQIWRQADYWATPLETMIQRRGDCEDFSIVKYFSLKLLGVATDKMRLTSVRARIGGPHSQLMQAHMVLAYYAEPRVDPLILDNLIAEIRPGSRRPDLFPVFGFNSEGLWVVGAGSDAVHSTARLSRWREVLIRVSNEGFEP